VNSKVKFQKTSLIRLRELTSGLIDRDLVRSRDVQLFTHFLENSPIRICLWTIDKDLNVIHQKCICPMSKDQNSLTRQFFEGSFKKELHDIHKKFISSNLNETKSLIGDEEDIYMLTLKKDRNHINGAALQVTSRVRILYVLLEVLKEKKSSNSNMATLIHDIIQEDRFSLSILELLEDYDG